MVLQVPAQLILPPAARFFFPPLSFFALLLFFFSPCFFFFLQGLQIDKGRAKDPKRFEKAGKVVHPGSRKAGRMHRANVHSARRDKSAKKEKKKKKKKAAHVVAASPCRSVSCTL
jgi:hypothetical protein